MVLQKMREGEPLFHALLLMFSIQTRVVYPFQKKPQRLGNWRILLVVETSWQFSLCLFPLTPSYGNSTMKDYTAIAWWFIWKERNTRVSEDQKEYEVNLKLKCIFLLNIWSDMANVFRAGSHGWLSQFFTHTVKLSF